MRAATIFERWYVASVLEPAVGRGRAIRRMAELAEIRDRLVTEATIAPMADVLDAGCGYGLVTYPAAEEAGHAVGLDPDSSLAAAATRVPAVGASFAAGDPARLPFPDERFDVVIWRGLLGRTHDRPALLRDVLRVLRPEGRLCFAEPAPLEAAPDDPGLRALWPQLRRAPDAVFFREGFERLVEQNGFTAVHARIERRRSAVEDERAVREVFDGAVPGSPALAALWAEAGVPDAIVRAFVSALTARTPTTIDTPEAYVTAEKPR